MKGFLKQTTSVTGLFPTEAKNFVFKRHCKKYSCQRRKKCYPNCSMETKALHVSVEKCYPRLISVLRWLCLCIRTEAFALDLGSDLCLAPDQACHLGQVKSFEPQCLCKGAVVVKGNRGVQAGCRSPWQQSRESPWQSRVRGVPRNGACCCWYLSRFSGSLPLTQCALQPPQ